MEEAQALRQAKQAISPGDKATAQRLVLQATRQNPQSEVAWLRLARGTVGWYLADH